MMDLASIKSYINSHYWFTVLWLILYTATTETSAQFSVQPESVVQAEGLEAVFQCLYNQSTNYIAEIIEYRWTFSNGPLPSDAEGSHETDDSPAALTIPALQQYNGSVIQCHPIFRTSDFILILSQNATLLVQGPLSAVTDLSVSADSSSCSKLTISWTPPSSLDLTTADPDIQYCVEVYTGGGSHHLDSVYGITDTQYTYTAPDSTGVYNFTVTPRSNINGSRNGTISLLIYNALPENADFEANTALSHLRVFFFPTDIHQCRMGPEYYRINIQPIDKKNSEPCSCANSDPEKVTGNMFVIELDCQPCGIKRHRRYKLLLYADDVLFEQMNISTHDVYKVSDPVVSVKGQVTIESEYLLDSTDKGFFIILSSGNHTLYRVAYRNGSEPSTTLTVSGLRNNVYRLAVYDLTNNSIHDSLQPHSHPAVLLEANLSKQNISAPPITTATPDPQITVTYTDGTICMACSTPGLSGCVGVIHSAPLDSYNLTVLTARAGVEKCTSERFQGDLSVAVFDVGDGGSPLFQKRLKPKTSTGYDVTTIAVSVSVSILLVAVILVVAVLCFKYCKKCKNPSNEVEMKERTKSDSSPTSPG